MLTQLPLAQGLPARVRRGAAGAGGRGRAARVHALDPRGQGYTALSAGLASCRFGYVIGGLFLSPIGTRIVSISNYPRPFSVTRAPIVCCSRPSRSAAGSRGRWPTPMPPAPTGGRSRAESPPSAPLLCTPQTVTSPPLSSDFFSAGIAEAFVLTADVLRVQEGVVEEAGGLPCEVAAAPPPRHELRQQRPEEQLLLSARPTHSRSRCRG